MNKLVLYESPDDSNVEYVAIVTDDEYGKELEKDMDGSGYMVTTSIDLLGNLDSWPTNRLLIQE